MTSSVLSRRTFLALSAMLPWAFSARAASGMPVGLELYSVRDDLKRPGYEIDYIRKYYARDTLTEPPCVLGFLQVFVLSNGDVLTGCYPLPAVGNILKQSLESILASEAYLQQSMAMIRRECPGCTCGVESSLAMSHAAASAIYEIGQLMSGSSQRKAQEVPKVAAARTGE